MSLGDRHADREAKDRGGDDQDGDEAEDGDDEVVLAVVGGEVAAPAPWLPA